MIKHILIVSILLMICHFGEAGNKADGSNSKAVADAAVRNSLKFNYDLLSGNTIDESSDLSDDFNIPIMRNHWDSRLKESEWTLKERPGYLRIKAQKIAAVEDILPGETFSHIIERNAVGEAVAMIDLSGMDNNSNAGLYCKSAKINFIGIQSKNGIKNLIVSVADKIIDGPELTGNLILLRIKIDVSKACFEYSFDGTDYKKLGNEFQISALNSDKNLIGFYCVSDTGEDCSIDIDWFYFNPKVDKTMRFAENENNILIPEI